MAFAKVCYKCNKEFTTNRKERKFCSLSCSNSKNKSKFKVKIEKNCLHCNSVVSVYPKQINFKYCSRNCRVKAISLDKEKIKLSKTLKINCKTCNKEVATVDKNKLYCSVICKTNDKKGINGNCVICNKIFYSFPTHSKTKSTCSKECRLIQWKETSRVNCINRLKNSISGFTPNYNKEACKIIELYGEENNYNFQHALNGGEYYIKELGYWVDGYDKEKNVVIEFDENKKFKNNKLKEKHILREEKIIKFLKCKFIRLKETDYPI